MARLNETMDEEKDKAIKPYKIAVLPTYSLNNIKNPVKKILKISGIDAEVRFGGYNQFVQEMMDKDSWLYNYSPDLILIALSYRSYLRDLEDIIVDGNRLEQEKLITEKMEMVKLAISGYGKQSAIVVTVVDRPIYSPLGISDFRSKQGLVSCIDTFNSRLIDLSEKDKRVFLLDFDKVCSRAGKEEMTDEKMYYLGGILLNSKTIEIFADELARFVRASLIGSKKCIVVDLDNTLWKGVIGEDGVGGIEIGQTNIGEIFSDIQRAIRNLKRKGVLLAIASKNNENDVIEAFEKREEMILKLDDFVIKKINWKSKAENIEEIAKELNIGLDSMVFLDDNPAERSEVAMRLPMVAVMEFPKDVANLPRMIKASHYFETVALTKEDKDRNRMYSEEMERDQLRTSRSVEDYLLSLNTWIEIRKDDENNIDRIAQLINKTNQFNLRTMRYTKDKVLEMMRSDKAHVFSLSAGDRFGELGITGVLILKDKGDHMFIDTFLLSCRILSRNIEDQFLIEVMKKFEGRKIRSEYIPSPKNSQTEAFYSRMGFKCKGGDGQGKRYHSVGDYTIPKNINWIKVRENE